MRAERCVHGHIAQARCRACVDACPTGAWVIDDERLGIDPDRCDGCDLCVPACPETALVQRFRPVVRKTRFGTLAFAACDRAGIQGACAPLMPCLNSLGIKDFLLLARNGIDCLIGATGDCSRCPRNHGEGFPERLAEVNRLLAAHELPFLNHQVLAAARWERSWRDADDPGNRRPVDRRAFFTSIFEETLRRVRESLDPPESDEGAPGLLLPPPQPGEAVHLAPVIDAMLCTGCDACLRICPREALRLDIRDGRAQAFVIVAERCSGCGLCVDLCVTRAIRIQRGGLLPVTEIPLWEQRCGSCGVTFHLPRAEVPMTGKTRPPPPSLCPICFRVDHQRRLFQVLD